MSRYKSQTQPYIIFLSGASGAGKTTFIKSLSDRLTTESAIFLHFDSIGIPSVDEMIKQYGSPTEWQRIITEQWIDTLIHSYKDVDLIFFEGQVNLEFIELGFKKYNFKNYRILLMHCSNTVRHDRLRILRNQPELINQEMDNWSSYLHKQALEKNITILDSGLMSTDEMVGTIMQFLSLLA
jgi:GTPase SAR1 family protein